MSSARCNLRAFIWFRLFFNCRFYYPVYAILFLDLGITDGQFALLNAVWAVAIVLLEVPSGALADQVGRRNLVIAAAVLMMLELAAICLAPVGGGALLFWLLVANRVLSGAAEAAASGADEALAYDALPAVRREWLWARVTGRLMRWMGAGMMLAFALGGLLYDARTFTWLFESLGLPLPERGTTLKWPLYLTGLTSIGALLAACSYRELGHGKTRAFWATVRSSFARVGATGRWILVSPAPLAVIVTAVTIDGWARLCVVNNSQIYRLMAIPEYWYGLIGAGTAGLGMVTARWAEGLHRSAHPSRNYAIAYGLVLVGLASLWWPIRHWGFVALMPLFVAMSLVNYLVSQHLNAVTPDDRRATVLSFKGLAMNLSFGAVMLLYAAEFGLVDRLGWSALRPELTQQAGLETFAAAIAGWLPLFLLAGCLLWWWLRAHFGRSISEMVERGRVGRGHSGG